MDSDGHDDGFASSRGRFEQVVAFLEGADAGGLTHGELEQQIATRGRQLLRQLLQDHLDVRAAREVRLAQVVDAAGVDRPSVETDHRRGLTTLFGQVEVTRLAYRRTGQANLHPTDAALNLPAEKHSHGLRRLAAVEATRGSFDDTVEAIGRSTGTRVGKRQVQQLAGRAAAGSPTSFDVLASVLDVGHLGLLGQPTSACSRGMLSVWPSSQAWMSLQR